MNWNNYELLCVVSCISKIEVGKIKSVIYYACRVGLWHCIMVNDATLYISGGHHHFLQLFIAYGLHEFNLCLGQCLITIPCGSIVHNIIIWWHFHVLNFKLQNIWLGLPQVLVLQTHFIEDWNMGLDFLNFLE